MKGFGLLLIVIGLGIALIAVMNNHETSYDAVLRQNRDRNAKAIGEVRNMSDAVGALGQMTEHKFDTRGSEATAASLQGSVANDTAELEERARARSSEFTKMLVVAAVSIVLGLVIRMRYPAPKTA
jgi:hypothetical protein